MKVKDLKDKIKEGIDKMLAQMRIPVRGGGGPFKFLISLFLMFSGALIFFDINPFQWLGILLKLDFLINIEPIIGLFMMIGGLLFLAT
jgi:hypothetical protein